MLLLPQPSQHPRDHPKQSGLQHSQSPNKYSKKKKIKNHQINVPCNAQRHELWIHRWNCLVLNRESSKWRLLHLVRALFTNSQYGDLMSRTQKLFCKVKSNYCVRTAVGVHYQHVFLLCCTGLDVEGTWIKAPGTGTWGVGDKWRTNGDGGRESRELRGRGGERRVLRSRTERRLMKAGGGSREEHRGWGSKTGHWLH